MLELIIAEKVHTVIATAACVLGRQLYRRKAVKLTNMIGTIPTPKKYVKIMKPIVVEYIFLRGTVVMRLSMRQLKN